MAAATGEFASTADFRLSCIEEKVDEIIKTLSVIAVQDEKLTRQASEISGLWKKVDRMQERFEVVCAFQAGCPKNTIKWIWMAVIPLGLTQIGLFIALLQLAHQLGTHP